MSIWKRIGAALTTRSYAQTEYGVSDELFLMALLESAPEGATVEFDRCEPEAWVHALRPWSHRAEDEDFEADCYSVVPAFVEAIGKLLEQTPSGLAGIHHMSIMSAAGECIFSSLDDFTCHVSVDKNLKASVDGRLHQAEPGPAADGCAAAEG